MKKYEVTLAALALFILLTACVYPISAVSIVVSSEICKELNQESD